MGFATSEKNSFIAKTAYITYFPTKKIRFYQLFFANN